MKKFVYLLIVFLTSTCVFAKTWVVDQNGLGDYTSISAAINVAKPGDVVKVNPGIYNEKVVINKDILVEGSGAENTTISWQGKDYTVDITSGKIKWTRITSSWIGIKSSGGVVTNCIVYNCSLAGIYALKGGKILHTISLDNKNGFLIKDNELPIITNCMSLWNTNMGFSEIYDISTENYPLYDYYPVEYCNSYGNKRNFNSENSNKKTGTITDDPQFNPNSYQISSGSPCVDAGNPAYQDPDGTRADMGYYGGPDAPTFPVINKHLIKLNEDGTIQIEAEGISPY